MENLSARIFLEETKGSSFFQSQGDDFLGLKLFSDELLVAGVNKEFELAADTYLLIIPVTGELIYKDTRGGDDSAIDAGQVLLISSPASFKFTIGNPFDDNEINYLLLKVKANQTVKFQKEILEFNLEQSENTLNIITSKAELSFRLGIGKFAGRAEATYELSNSGFFCFVLSGAFEVQGRLLHAKDGLALWNTSKVELEALSNNAIIVTVELSYI